VAGWYEETFDGQIRVAFKMGRTLVQRRSAYQTIEIFETRAFGKALALDGLMMTSERDEYFYHEMIAHVPLCMVAEPRDVLVIGGGDGGTAREVLRHPSVRAVTMVEIDGEVIDVCREHLPGHGAWDDPRLEVRVEDGIAFTRHAPDASFDAVLLDGSDPVGPAEGLFDASFYRHVRRVLRPRGVFGLQSESPVLQARVFAEVQHTLGRVFEHVRPYFGTVPLYGASTWSWTVASRGADSSRWDEERLGALEPRLRYLNRDVARAAFAQPNDIRRLLAGDPNAGPVAPVT